MSDDLTARITEALARRVSCGATGDRYLVGGEARPLLAEARDEIARLRDQIRLHDCGGFHRESEPCPELPDNQESDMPDNERPRISAEDMALIAALVTKSSQIDAELYLKPSSYVIPEDRLPGVSTLYGVPVTRGDALGVVYGVEVPELIPEAREAFESMAERVGDELG